MVKIGDFAIARERQTDQDYKFKNINKFKIYFIQIFIQIPRIGVDLNARFAPLINAVEILGFTAFEKIHSIFPISLSSLYL